jgi:ABC-2 type transport system ATP-binding protein
MENIIEVRDLTKRFKNFAAVDSISFEIHKGEIFGFLGPNGAGKSTTIRMLVTLMRPTSGQASVSGHDIVKDQDEVREHIGLVAEKIILYNLLTAWENLEFFGGLFHLSKQEIHRRAEKWIDKLHMTEWMSTKVANYSTGMKQRINIVRALLTEPDVLFLDEPTLGLDPQTTNLIRKFIEELNGQGVSVLLTTHDMIEAEALSDRVAIIDHGKIAAMDTVDNLKNKVPEKENPTMEDVFLRVTGEKIRDSKQNAAPRVGGPGRHFDGPSTSRIR